MIINVSVRDRHATAIGDPTIICGNSDYKVKFAFDDEWSGVIIKTARFVYNKNGHETYVDVIFAGDTVDMPPISNANSVKIGVFGDDIITTTSALIKAKPSIRCGTGVPDDPTPSQYEQIISLLASINEAKIAVDSELSGESENPIANKAVHNALSQLISNIEEAFEAATKALEDIDKDIDDVAKASHGHENKDFLDRLTSLKTINGESIVGEGNIELEIPDAPAPATADTPTFDLTELGLSVVSMDGTTAFVETDTTEIMAALDKGVIKVLLKFTTGSNEMDGTAILNNIHIVGDVYICSYAFEISNMRMMFNVMVGDGYLAAYFSDLSGSGSSDLPEVSIEDEGMFLRVVNGVWSAVSLTDVSTEGA